MQNFRHVLFFHYSTPEMDVKGRDQQGQLDTGDECARKGTVTGRLCKCNFVLDIGFMKIPLTETVVY